MLKQDGWRGFPSGREKIAMELKLSRKEIEGRYKLEFKEASDGLGREYSTYFNDNVLGTVTILIDDAIPRTAGVYIDSKLSTRAAIPRLIDVFALSDAFLNLPNDSHRD